MEARDGERMDMFFVAGGTMLLVTVCLCVLTSINDEDDHGVETKMAARSLLELTSIAKLFTDRVGFCVAILRLWAATLFVHLLGLSLNKSFYFG